MIEIALIFGLFIPSLLTEAEEGQRIPVELERARIGIFECQPDEKEEECIARRWPESNKVIGPDGKPVLLTMRMIGNNYYIPKNIEEAVNELKQMLPVWLYNDITTEYGFVESFQLTGRSRPETLLRGDLSVSLNLFLIENWNLKWPAKHLLARQIMCLGSNLHNFSSVYMMLAGERAYESDGDIINDLKIAHGLNEHIIYLCKEELGIK